MSQLEHADFCDSDRSLERRLCWRKWQRRKLPGDILAARDTGTVQYKYGM